MTVAELILRFSELPEDTEVVIVHADWQIKKVEFNTEKKQVRIS